MTSLITMVAGKMRFLLRLICSRSTQHSHRHANQSGTLQLAMVGELARCRPSRRSPPSTTIEVVSLLGRTMRGMVVG